MQLIQEQTRGLWLLFDLNRDRLLSAAAVIIGLPAGMVLGTLLFGG